VVSLNDYNNLKYKLKELITNFNSKFNESYCNYEEEKTNLSIIKKIFNNKNIKITIKRIAYIEYIFFENEKVKLEIFMQRIGNWSYDIHEIKILVNKVYVTYEDGPWYECANNNFISKIDLCFKEFYEYIKYKKLRELEEHNKKLNIARSMFKNGEDIKYEHKNIMSRLAVADSKKDDIMILNKADIHEITELVKEAFYTGVYCGNSKSYTEILNNKDLFWKEVYKQLCENKTEGNKI